MRGLERGHRDAVRPGADPRRRRAERRLGFLPLPAAGAAPASAAVDALLWQVNTLVQAHRALPEIVGERRVGGLSVKSPVDGIVGNLAVTQKAAVQQDAAVPGWQADRRSDSSWRRC